MDTLPDYLAPGLRLLSVGINPSLRAVREGFYFPNPQNRFWPALNASGLLAQPVAPGPAAMDLILTRDRIGFTDLCKTASSMAHHLRAADYCMGAQRLAQVVGDCRPPLLWFHGATAYRAFCRHVLAPQDVVMPGLQPQTFAGARIFVSPNPSPANARYSLLQLIDCYRQLAACVADAPDGRLTYPSGAQAARVERLTVSQVIPFRNRDALDGERAKARANRQCQRGYHNWQIADPGPHAAPGRMPMHWRCARCGLEREGATPGTPPAGRL